MELNLPLIIVVLMCMMLLTLVIFKLNRRKQQRKLFLTLTDELEQCEESDLSAYPPGDSDFDDLLLEPLPAESVATAQPVKADRLLILHVMAKPGYSFVGYELLQTLVSVGLRYGQMNIFHRYVNVNGEFKILFSLASATEPGSFDLNAMGGFSCQGLSLFLNLDQLGNPHKIFNLMLDTAQQLAEELDGILMDDKRQPLTEESMTKYLQQMSVIVH